MSRPRVSGSFRSCSSTIFEMKSGREPQFRHPAPEYVRFERPPVVESLPPVQLDSGESVRCSTNYYDYGVMSVEFELPFEFDWDRLVKSSAEWITAPQLGKKSGQVVRLCQSRVGPALRERYFEHRPPDRRLWTVYSSDRAR
jgi:hypothetical protein